MEGLLPLDYNFPVCWAAISEKTYGEIFLFLAAWPLAGL